ncbi:hypothetical protein HPP92_029036 [Vanilla planifolia]|uniref:Uncharacterized protein n=1 Tax=Vanilla planifolia TaxID=51239 RepID=A0A835P3R9_VANPL|nr:hypothetical protein HPP92_029036 [Vanilla planifolia]KAG0446053.1 hypothetical protein HPP92_029024 [Vanilla planifolia]
MAVVSASDSITVLCAAFRACSDCVDFAPITDDIFCSGTQSDCHLLTDRSGKWRCSSFLPRHCQTRKHCLSSQQNESSCRTLLRLAFVKDVLGRWYEAPDRRVAKLGDVKRDDHYGEDILELIGGLSWLSKHHVSAHFLSLINPQIVSHGPQSGTDVERCGRPMPQNPTTSGQSLGIRLALDASNYGITCLYSGCIAPKVGITIS